MESDSYQASLFDRLSVWFFQFVNKYIPWHKLPPIVGALNLAAYRTQLRQQNLYDTYVTGAAQGDVAQEPLKDPRFLGARNSDGKYNSLDLPLMGCAGMRLGRNFPRKFTQKPSEEELWTPNPRLVSDRFMARKPDGFIPATTLNLLAAAWIQFQVHDWVFHESVS